jgi:hypothetical protein
MVVIINLTNPGVRRRVLYGHIKSFTYVQYSYVLRELKYSTNIDKAKNLVVLS